MAWKDRYTFSKTFAKGETTYTLQYFTNENVEVETLPLHPGSNQLRFSSSDESVGLGYLSFSIEIFLRNQESAPIIDSLKLGSWRLIIEMTGYTIPYLYPDFTSLDESPILENTFRNRQFSVFSLVFMDGVTLNKKTKYGTILADISQSTNAVHEYNSGTDLGHVPISDLLAEFIWDKFNQSSETSLFVNHGLYIEENLTPFEDPLVPFTPSSTGIHIFANILVAPHIFFEHVTELNYKPLLEEALNFFSTIFYSKLGFSIKNGGFMIRELGCSNYTNDNIFELIHDESSWRTYSKFQYNVLDLDDIVPLDREIKYKPKPSYEGIIINSKFGKDEVTLEIDEVDSDTNFEFNSGYDIEKSNDLADDVMNSSFGMSIRDFNEDFDIRPTNLLHTEHVNTFDEIDTDFLRFISSKNLVFGSSFKNRNGITITVNSVVDPMLPFKLNDRYYTCIRGIIDTKRYITTIEDSVYEPNTT